MDNIDHDHNLQRMYAPEIFEPEYISIEEASELSELFCPNDGSRLYEYPQADSPDDYHMVAYCKRCQYTTE